MKITSINFVPREAVPQVRRNTEIRRIVGDLVEQLKKVPAGQSLEFHLEGAKRHHRQSIQHALRRSFNNKLIYVVQQGERFFVTR
jgi:hypothetical protein